MFAAAAAAHMHFLSAAAAAASFTSSLPTVQANTPATSNGTPTANSAPTRRGEDGVISSSPSFTSSGLGRKPPSDPWMPQPANVAVSKSFELGRQNSRKPNCDLETSACSPQDEASSEPDGGRLISRLKKTHIKKPLNAFMLFMKEMRPRVQEECTLKESAAINQILGKKWHELSRAEQTKYYEMARQAKELHQRLYPGWSARDNYAYHARRRHRRSRRPFPHHRHFVRKPNSSSSTINTPSKASPSGRLRSSSFHEDRKVLELPQKSVERPHSANDVYSSPIERRVTSSSPQSPPPPPQSPSVITNRVSVQQLQHQVAPRSSLMPRPSLPPSPPLPQTQLLTHTGAFVNPPQPASQPPIPLSKPASTLATNALTMSACSAFEQHYNQAGHHQQSQQQHQQQQQHQHHHQFLQLPSQRSFGYSAPSVSSAAVAVSMYASAQSQARGGPIGRSPTGYWGYLGQQMTSHSPGAGVKRNPYLSAAAAMNNDSVAAVAAVAAMAVGELSSGSMKKCRARFGLEHQNLWCKPCRRKKKCIRFISENEVDDYMPHHHSYQARSAAAAAAAAAAVAFNHHHRHHSHQQQPPSQGTNHPYGMFGAARRHRTGGNGYSGLVETTSNVSMRKQNYMQSSVSPFGNGVGGTQQRPYARQMIAQHFTIPAINNSGYTHPPLYNSYKRPFPMTTSSRQQTLGEYAYTGNSGGGGYWGSNSRCATTADAAANCFPSASVRFSTSEIMMSQGEPKSLAALLRETQGSNPSPSVYTSPKMNSFSHSQQGTTVATNSSMVNSIPTTAAPVATNGRINNSHHMKREAPPLSFGVADVMGFRSREEGGTLNTAAATTMTSMSASTNASTFRGTASPSTSCPLRSSPELE